MSTIHRLDACGDPLSPGAVQRLGVRRLKHTMRMGNDRAETACFNPDGQLLAVERASVGLRKGIPDGSPAGRHPDRRYRR